ncbi:MAG: hypothetical protein DI637_02120 [Citromicrobium sp.]|nr:MAG: hypothetical protein DI637_02120 [Citromicrobium sp.]
MVLRNILFCAASVMAIQATATPEFAYAQEITHQFDIPAQSMGVALRKLGETAKTPIVFDDEAVTGLRSNPVRGRYTTRAALNALIGDANLRVSVTPSGVITISPAADRVASSGPTEQSTFAEIIVVGDSQTLNADIRHNENEARPYVVLTEEDIESSQALSINEFLSLKLPQNNVSTSAGTSGFASPASGIDLRGLGSTNTLLLIDGRPAPRTFNASGLSTQDINGIPLSSIERIEVLPASSGGLYGGNAIGGVVNVILKRNYSGVTISAGYQNTFETNAPIANVEIAGGLRFNEGRTRVTFSAARKIGEDILISDRPWVEQARAIRLENAPEQYYSRPTPPLGSTPNIRSVNSQPLVLLDGRSLNSPFTHVPLGYVAGDSLQGFIDNAGEYNLTLADNALGERRSLRTTPETLSLALGIRQEVTDWLEVFLDGRLDSNKGSTLDARIPSTVTIAAGAPQNPFRQAIRVAFPVLGFETTNRQEFETSKILLGGIFRISPEWNASLDLGWGRNKNMIVYTDSIINSRGVDAIRSGLRGPDGQPAINILQDPAVAAIDFSSYLNPIDNQRLGPFIGTEFNGTLRIGGPLPSIFGIEPKFAGGADFTRSILNSTVTESLIDYLFLPEPRISYTYYPERTRNAYSAFGNLTLPLIPEGSEASWGNRAELSGTIRYDRFVAHTYDNSQIITLPTRDASPPDTTYTDVTDSSVGYTLSALYGPTRDIFFRASYATGFNPPALSDRVSRVYNADIGEIADPYSFSNPYDPQRGFTQIGSQAAWTFVTGGNPELEPETSKTLALGLVVTPRWIDGLRFSVDYIDTKRKNEINLLQFSNDLLINEESYPDRVVREDRPLTDEEIALGYTATPVVYLDNTPINMANSRVTSIDFSADYQFEIERIGDFTISVAATKQLEASRKLTPTSEEVDRINWAGQPLKWRGNASLYWERGAVSAGLAMQYYNKYRIGNPGVTEAANKEFIDAQGGAYVPAQYYVDFSSSVDLSKVSSAPFMDGARLRFGIRNLFDTAPELYVFQERSAPSGDALGRRFTVNLTKEF